MQQLNQLYFAFVQPHIDYGLSIWGNTSKQNLSKVQRFQNRASRIVTNNFDLETSSAVIIRQLKWQTVEERRDYLLCLLIYKCVNAQAPTYLSDSLVFVEDTHSRNTRQVAANLLHVPKANTNYYKGSLAVAGAKSWNNLPPAVRNAVSVSCFKYQYKHFNCN